MQTVLVVDDPELCRMYGVFLEVQGHDVREFMVAEAAAAWCEAPEHEVKAVFISLNRHGSWAGLDLARRIAKARPEARITATTGYIQGVPPGLPASIRMVPKGAGVVEFFDLGDSHG